MPLSVASPMDLSARPVPLPRSCGALDLQFAARDGATCALRTFQQGILRVRFPNVAKDAAPEAILINTAGGMTGGDQVSMKFALGAQACAVIATQAHEKIYRASQGQAAITAAIHLESGASLEWLPQPTILFDRARLTRVTEVNMAADARLLAVEALIFGRTAMSETMKNGALDDHWTIRRDGRLIHHDRFRMQDDTAALLSRPPVLDGKAAMATIRLVAPDAAARLDDMRALLADDGAASAWNGMLIARLVAQDGYQLGQALARVLTGMRGRPLPPIWTI